MKETVQAKADKACMKIGYEEYLATDDNKKLAMYGKMKGDIRRWITRQQVWILKPDTSQWN